MADNKQFSRFDTLRDTVMDDLLKRFPEGKDGKLTKRDYQMVERWSQSADVSRDTPILIEDNGTVFGWPVEDIVRSLWRADNNIRHYISRRWPDLTSKAITRRYNRLNDRIQPVVSRFSRREGPGIWKAGERYGDGHVFVVASTQNAAKLLASTMFAGAGLMIDKYYMDAKRVMVSDPDALLFYNKQNIESIAGTLERSRKKLEDLKKKVESLSALHETLKTYETLQHSILTS